MNNPTTEPVMNYVYVPTSNIKTDHFADLLALAGCKVERICLKPGGFIFRLPDLSPPTCSGCGYQFAIGDGEAPEDSGLCCECSFAKDEPCHRCGGEGMIDIDMTAYSTYTMEPVYRRVPCHACNGKG